MTEQASTQAEFTDTEFTDTEFRGAVPRDAEFSALDCISATFGVVAARLGHDPSVLGDQWGYHRRADAVGTEWPVELLGIHRRAPEEILRNWYGLDTTVREHGSSEEALARVREQLAAGVPVVAWVDTFHIPYSSFHGRQHHAHRMVVCGYGEGASGDGDGRVGAARAAASGPPDRPFHVIDRYQGFPYDGPLDAGTLAAAMSSAALGEARRGDPDWRNRTLVVRPGRAGGSGPAAGERFRAALVRNTVEAASAAGLPTAAADALRDDPARYADLSPVGVIEVSAWFGELASQRALNARFLRAAAEACGVPVLRERAAEAEALSRRWEMTRNVFSLRLRQGAPAVVRVAGLLTETVARETAWNERVAEDIAPGS
ncbi:BtrH N-terminal domain-containing protein [Streptomyces sp. NPDC058417]|uniref:BtrH N-terminal domain-containing protein n=1 Tax=unclassified Streptomyces TaxID=2593676 RepID=UPI003666C7B0